MPTPRLVFALTVTDGQVTANVEAFAEDVTRLEIARLLIGSIPALLANPGDVFPSRDVVMAQRTEAKFATEHPATALFVRDGAFLWLDDDAAAEFGAHLAARGWQRGPIPPGTVPHGCDYCRDPDAFRAAQSDVDA
jgi:hypothetical protein